ncbi:helix-turn-helix domain-containing protein [Rhodococcus hoagii]|nr:helix-turn-helix domain-containing protein [Prescottella equi]
MISSCDSRGRPRCGAAHYTLTESRSGRSESSGGHGSHVCGVCHAFGPRLPAGADDADPGRLRRSDADLSLDQIARRSGLPRSSTHRIIVEMIELDWLTRWGRNFRLGPRALGAVGPQATHAASGWARAGAPGTLPAYRNGDPSGGSRRRAGVFPRQDRWPVRAAPPLAGRYPAPPPIAGPAGGRCSRCFHRRRWTT